MAYRKSCGVRLAKLALWSPFAGILLLMVLPSAMGNPDNILRSVIAAGISALFFAGGLVLGIKALRRMKYEGRKGIMGRALTGAALNGLLLCLVIVLSGASTYLWELTAKLKAQIASAAQETNAKVALLQAVSQEFGSKMKDLAKKYESSWAALTNPPVLDMASVKSREELKVRREMVDEFIAESKALLDIAEHGTELYRQELLKHDLPRELREAGVKGFAQSFSNSNTRTLIAMRHADVRRGEAILKVVNLLEETWGQWEHLPATRKLQFQDAAQAAEYNAAMKELNQATEETLGLQRQISQKNSGNKRAGS